MSLYSRISAFCLATTLATAAAATAMGRKPAAPPEATAAPPALAVTVIPAPGGGKAAPAIPQASSAPSTTQSAIAPAPAQPAEAPSTTQSAIADAPAQPAGAPAAETAVATPGGPQPRIVFTELKHDFGEVIGVEKIDHAYAFRNDGKAELRVDKVSTTCGCTAAATEPKALPPGGTGEIKATFTTAGRQGKQVKHIYVHSNDPVEPKVCLTLEGTIIPPLAVEPASVMLQDTQAESARTVRISQTLPEELTLKEPVTRLKMVTATLRNDPPEKGRKRYAVEIALKPDLASGRYSENVSIETNCASKPKIDIPVRINVSGEIAASPSRLSLGRVEPGQEIARSITLASRRDKEFKVLKVEVDNPAFTVSPSASPEAAKAFTFTVKGTPVSATGGVRAKVTFTTDNPKHATIDVPIYGWLRAERTPVPPAAAAKGSQAAPPAGR